MQRAERLLQELFQKEVRRHIPERKEVKTMTGREIRERHTGLQKIDLSQPNPILLIEGDVREPTILNILLGGNKADSASLSFSGGGAVRIVTPGVGDLKLL